YLIPFVLIEDPFKVAARASAMGWLSVLYLATLSSALAYFLWNEAIAKLEVTKVGAFLYAIPIPTMILGYFFLSEEITLALVAGVLLVIFGIYLTEAS
ncbi:TPA: EamA family transporter, partial [Candidatus Bathyarchaeota archaeon]|nr:EamA family transporter [Candidatus Bathyarchaeota archaeon]